MKTFTSVVSAAIFAYSFAILTGLTPCVGAQIANVSQSGTSSAGPFGFFYGETKAQVVGQLGRSVVKKETPDRLYVTAAPKPYPEFEEYHLLFSPEKGLLKIVAVGKTIDADSFGSGLREHFDKLKGGLVENYGSGKDFDYLHSGSIWNDDRDFMMALTKHERTLTSYWLKLALPNHLRTISLEGQGLSSSAGFITLSYEFEGWEAYADKLNAKDNSVL